MANLAVLAGISILTLPLSAKADCKWIGPSPHSNHYYNGRLGNGETVRAVFSFHRCSVTGTWFDSIWFADYEVAGVLTEDHKVALTLRNGRQQVIATVTGVFPQRDVFGQISGPLRSDMLLGSLFGKYGYNGQTVELRLARSWSGTDAEVASAVGITDQASFDRATLRFWRAVRDHDVATVAACIRYPLPVLLTQIEGGRFASRSLTVRSAAMLERDYDQIFNWYRRDQILSELPRHLIWGQFSNTVAIPGVVEFDSEGQVIGLPWSANPSLSRRNP